MHPTALAPSGWAPTSSGPKRRPACQSPPASVAPCAAFSHSASVGGARRASGRTRRPRTSRRAAPARGAGSGSTRPNRRRVQPSSPTDPELRVLERRPPCARPSPSSVQSCGVVVAAGRRRTRRTPVGHRRRVDAERGEVDDVRGPLVVVRPRVGRRAHRERTGVDEHVARGGRVDAGGARAVAGRRVREVVHQLDRREQRLVVLVLVVDDQAVDEPVGEQRVRRRRGRRRRARRATRLRTSATKSRASVGSEQVERRAARRAGGGTRRRCRRSAGRSARRRRARAAATAPRSGRCARGPRRAATSAASAARRAGRLGDRVEQRERAGPGRRSSSRPRRGFASGVGHGRLGLPAPGDPLVEVGALGADRGVEAVAGEHEVVLGGRVNSRRSIDSMIWSKLASSNFVLPGPPGKRVSPLNTTGWPSSRKQVEPGRVARGVDRAQAQVADLDHVVVGDHEVVGREHRGVLAGDADVDPGVADRGDGLDVVEVAVGGEDPADPGGLADLEQQLVLVGRVDEDGVAGLPWTRRTKTLFSNGPDHELVDPDVGGLVVRGTGGSGRTRLRVSAAGRPGRVRGGMETGPVGQVRSARPMDFRDTPAEAAFRDEVRTWLAEHLIGEFAEIGARRRPGRRDRLRPPDRVGAAARQGPLGRPVVARGVRRARRRHRRAGHLQRGVRQGRRPGPDQLLRRGPVRADADRLRHRGAEAALPPEDPVGRGAVVPGLLRAERRLRPGQRADPRPCSTATSGSSTARRSGRRSRTAPTGASSSPAPTPTPPSHKGSPTSSCRWTSPASTVRAAASR